MTDSLAIDGVVGVFLDGGWLMIPLGLLALLIYGLGFRLFFYFSEHAFYRTPRAAWSGWIQAPESSPIVIRSILQYTQEEMGSVRAVQARFEEVRSKYLTFPDTTRRALMGLIAAAPLMGLLGTVMGMLTTFTGLGRPASGDTVDVIATGVSEALITTQTGLVVALPGYILLWAIHRRRNEMNECLNVLESLTVQLCRREGSLSAGEGSPV